MSLSMKLNPEIQAQQPRIPAYGAEPAFRE
jgi:hypothetical protein